MRVVHFKTSLAVWTELRLSCILSHSTSSWPHREASEIKTADKSNFLPLCGQGSPIRIMGNPALNVAVGNISHLLALRLRAWNADAFCDGQWRRCNLAPQLNVRFGVPVKRARDGGGFSWDWGWWMTLDINICGRMESPLLWYHCCQSGSQTAWLFVTGALWLFSPVCSPFRPSDLSDLCNWSLSPSYVQIWYPFFI